MKTTFLFSLLVLFVSLSRGTDEFAEWGVVRVEAQSEHTEFDVSYPLPEMNSNDPLNTRFVVTFWFPPVFVNDGDVRITFGRDINCDGELGIEETALELTPFSEEPTFCDAVRIGEALLEEHPISFLSEVSMNESLFQFSVHGSFFATSSSGIPFYDPFYLNWNNEPYIINNFSPSRWNMFRLKVRGNVSAFSAQARWKKNPTALFVY